MADPLSGFIRFVGGPLHNQHLRLAWRSHVEFAEYMPREVQLAAWPVSFSIGEIAVKILTYERRLMQTARGAVFFEFHCSEDLREHSGGDG